MDIKIFTKGQIWSYDDEITKENTEDHRIFPKRPYLIYQNQDSDMTYGIHAIPATLSSTHIGVRACLDIAHPSKIATFRYDEFAPKNPAKFKYYYGMLSEEKMAEIDAMMAWHLGFTKECPEFIREQIEALQTLNKARPAIHTLMDIQSRSNRPNNGTQSTTPPPINRTMSAPNTRPEQTPKKDRIVTIGGLRDEKKLIPSKDLIQTNEKPLDDDSKRAYKKVILETATREELISLCNDPFDVLEKKFGISQSTAYRYRKRIETEFPSAFEAAETIRSLKKLNSATRDPKYSDAINFKDKNLAKLNTEEKRTFIYISNLVLSTTLGLDNHTINSYKKCFKSELGITN